MSKKPSFSLLNDTMLGHLFCVYTKYYQPLNDTYYFIIKATDHLAASLPLMKLYDIKVTLGIDTIALLDQRMSVVKALSEQALHPSSVTNNTKWATDSVRKLRRLLAKYKPHETPIETKDLNKIRSDRELYPTLAFVVSFNQEQYKKLHSFLKKYLNLYLLKELDGQQNYALPQFFMDKILNIINEPEYIKMFGFKNIQINNENNVFFWHSVMALVAQKKIAIRKISIIDQGVYITLDNLIHVVPQDSTFSVDNKQYCWFENKTLSVTLKDGSKGTLDFEDQRNSNKMFDVFTILFAHWQRYADEVLETTEIERRLIKKGYDEDDLKGDFMKSTIGNIRKKIRGKNLTEIVRLETGAKGYYLQIKSPFR